ncbi:MAG: tyrosine-type recombinase/integrase [Deltaproteobacteria bacterium]|nr:tyrosine-type recombinase/integrase [Deltaproteobacteria bacterium]
MDPTEVIIRYRRFMRRVNYSKTTVRNYIFNIKSFLEWLVVPIDEVTSNVIFEYIGYLHNRRLMPKSINSYLNGIRRFYDYLKFEERINIVNPVKYDHQQILPKSLPKFLKEHEIKTLFAHITNKRDIAMFMLMLRGGLRVGEIANLTFPAIDFERKSIIVLNGKFRRDRIVYMSDDTIESLHTYIKIRPSSKTQKVFLVQRGFYRGKPLSIRGIQKRIENYAKKTGLLVSCHRFRHTMATQLLNADAMLATVQELMGHGCVLSTQRYAKVSNTKVRRDYFKAMEFIMARNKNIQSPNREDSHSFPPEREYAH